MSFTSLSLGAQKYITLMQIVQFGMSFVLSVLYVLTLADGEPCLGAQSYGFEFTLACNVSFFALFLQFYSNTYSSATVDDQGRKLGISAHGKQKSP